MEHQSGRRFGIAAIGGAGLATLVILVSPAAGTAHAHGYSTPPGDAVGRPGLDNPAPGVRLTQAIGDHIFNQSTPLNKALDDSPMGLSYHAAFGSPNYEIPTHGSNGTWTGFLNMPGPLRDGYNAVYSSGTVLPKEQDMPGTVIRALSGAPAPAPHSTGGAPARSKPAPAASSAPKKCTTGAAAPTARRAKTAC